MSLSSTWINNLYFLAETFQGTFSSLAQGTFDSLVSLKSLEFQTPFLLCDCNLTWLLRWIKDRNMVVKNTKCSFPQSLQGQLITSIKPELLTCDAPLELPSFQLTPSQRQVVFQGDSLPFQCQASFVAEDMQVLWYQNGRMVKQDAAQGIFIEKHMVQNCSLIARYGSVCSLWHFKRKWNKMCVDHLQHPAGVHWELGVPGQDEQRQHHQDGPHRVLESSAEYCAPERISNNKGEFKWPRTLAGIRAYLPCNRLPSSAGTYSGSSGEEQKAWRYCDHKGLWTEEDYSRCQFQKDVTRFLFVINQMPLNESNVVARARRLLVYTVEAANFSDKMDIIFVADMIEKFGKFVEKFKDLGEVMISMASNLMLADERVLWMAQREASACSRIIACLQKIAVYRLATAQAFSLVNLPNIALEAHAVRAADWNGMTCMLFQRPSPERSPGGDRQLTFKCNTTSSFSSILHKSTIVEASLQLPQALFTPAALPGHPEDTVYKLHLLAFRNGKFFPSTSNSSQLADGGKRRSVATPVIMAKIDGMSLRVLRSPVNITLRRRRVRLLELQPGGGAGRWQSDGCRILDHHDNFTTISCNSLGNYALLMDLSSVELFAPSIRPLHPVIYATTIILLICLLTITISYIYHHRSVRVSRKFWHMLVNLCFHICLTYGVFVGGINQTRYASVCQAIGILLHYSTLATALWVGVTARNIYKQVTRKAKRYEELDEPPPPPRPMLRFYLIGGGIPIIVCGITAAANIKNYGSRTNAQYCWMAWEPSIGAFYGPVGFIIFVDCMYFLSILLQLRPPLRVQGADDDEQQHLALVHSEGGGDAPSSHCHPSLCSCSLRILLCGLRSTLGAAVGAGERAHLRRSADGGGGGGAVRRPLGVRGHGRLAGAPLRLGLHLPLRGGCAGSGGLHGGPSLCQQTGYEALLVPGLLLGETGLLCPGGRAPASAGRSHDVDSRVSEQSRRGVDACGQSSADSSYTNKSAPSVRNSAHGSKLTNLHAEAAQCKTASAPVTANGAAVLDNSLTEHSIDNEIKMHVAPLEVQFRPMNNINNPAALPNGHVGRHHKNRARAHRASRLTVLREYAYDVPTSVEGSVQSANHRRHHHYDVAARNSRRAAYMAYRERHQSQQQHDSSDSASLPRRPRNADKGGGGTLGNGTVVTVEKEQVTADAAAGSDASKDSDPVPQPDTELETQPKSYGLNLITQNGGTLKENGQLVPLLTTESAASIKTGLWKHETTV
ncbi:hypothetical protein F7725_004461 [Dissostichus mawsoni]|uniref:Adhesion G protein-coupled receptor A3 n=1 Tax=Dissostichus mawsoni TaxID=36200 RepID=A0A7J5XK58_DISMA|nr:hypothetical protein F7725_004461 [Dissostichus mawsoni]